MPEKKNPAREQLSYPVAEDIEGTLSILSALPCRPGTPLSVPLKDIPGRTAAASVKAPFSLPGFRRSRYDGFALSSAELLNASPATPVTLAVSAFLPAGSPLSSLVPGTCARIMTGAALPDGADCVVPFEEAGPEISRRVRFTAPASPGRYIGATDSDLATGETVIRKGSLLTPLSAARAALSGQTEIRVYPRPSAAVLSTGSELITPGTPLTPGKIYNSSQYAIRGVITQEGCRAVPSGTVPDRSDAIAERITALLGENDCVITTGGVGGGDCDLMAGALIRAGLTPVSGGCRLRPGGNFLAASSGDKYVFALSGGPGSAMLALHLFVLPCLRRAMGRTAFLPPSTKAFLGELPARRSGGLTTGNIRLEGGRAVFHPRRLRDIEQQGLGAILALRGDEPLGDWMREEKPVNVYLCGSLRP